MIRRLFAICLLLTIVSLSRPLPAADDTLGLCAFLKHKSSGVPVDGSHTFVFRLCDGTTGENCSFQETQTINVNNGNFCASIGAVEPLPDPSETPAFMEMTLDDEVFDRFQIASVPFARFASVAESCLSLPATGVTAGTYTNPSVTVDEAGRITSVSNGSSSDTQILEVDTTSTCNSGTSETTLLTYSLPANTLSTDGEVLEVRLWGTSVVGIVGVITLRCYFGSTQIISTTSVSNVMAASNWMNTSNIIRTGAASQQTLSSVANTRIDGDGSGAPASISIISTASESLSDAVTIRCTGQSTNASEDICLTGFTVKLLD